MKNKTGNNQFKQSEIIFCILNVMVTPRIQLWSLVIHCARLTLKLLQLNPPYKLSFECRSRLCGVLELLKCYCVAGRIRRVLLFHTLSLLTFLGGCRVEQSLQYSADAVLTQWHYRMWTVNTITDNYWAIVVSIHTPSKTKLIDMPAQHRKMRFGMA
jgi:hypothetical protein